MRGPQGILGGGKGGEGWRDIAGRPGSFTTPTPRPHAHPALPGAQIGHTTDGGYGFGWKDDTGDSGDYPFDDTLATKLANEARTGAVGAVGAWGAWMGGCWRVGD